MCFLETGSNEKFTNALLGHSSTLSEYCEQQE